jgi:hypothetical protein
MLINKRIVISPRGEKNPSGVSFVLITWLKNNNLNRKIPAVITAPISILFKSYRPSIFE